MELFGFCSIRCGVGIWGKFVVSDRPWLPTGSVPFLTCQERNRKKQPEERRNLFSFGTAYKSALFSPRKKCPLLWTLLQRYALIVFFLLSLLCRFATEDNLQFDLQIPIYRTVYRSVIMGVSPSISIRGVATPTLFNITYNLSLRAETTAR